MHPYTTVPIPTTHQHSSIIITRPAPSRLDDVDDVDEKYVYVSLSFQIFSSIFIIRFTTHNTTLPRHHLVDFTVNCVCDFVTLTTQSVSFVCNRGAPSETNFAAVFANSRRARNLFAGTVLFALLVVGAEVQADPGSKAPGFQSLIVKKHKPCFQLEPCLLSLRLPTSWARCWERT